MSIFVQGKTWRQKPLFTIYFLKTLHLNKIPAEKKIGAINPYLQGLSYRQTARILGISHTRAEAVQKIAEAIYRPKILAVEETIIKIKGRKKWLKEVMPQPDSISSPEEKFLTPAKILLVWR